LLSNAERSIRARGASSSGSILRSVGLTALPALAALLALLAPLALAGCGSDEPVGGIKAEPAAVRLVYPQPVPVRLTWTPSAAVDSDTGKLLVFAHLISAPKQIVRTFDHPFPQAWTPGKPVSYTLDLGQSALVPPLAPGRYRLTVGLYDGERHRWPLSGAEAVASKEYAVADVEVPAGRPASPSFRFSETWGAPEKTGDSQTVLRRWVDKPSTIAVEGAPMAGAVRLTLRIPEVQQQGGERLLLDPGYARPIVAIDSTCDGKPHPVHGFGPHTVEIPVAAGQACQITVDPRFAVARTDTVTPRSPAFLEELLWKPEAPAPAR